MDKPLFDFDSFFQDDGMNIPVLDVTASIEASLSQNNSHLTRLFNQKVDFVKSLLKSESTPVLFIASSNGKDSTTIVHIALEAQRQCIAEGSIPQNHPICISTIDTGVEQLPMQVFSNYAIGKIKAYAERHGINLLYDSAKPHILDEFAIKYVGAQSMLVNPTRNANCTDYFKITPSKKLLAKYRSQIGDSTSMICLVGSRVSESQRRAGNVAKMELDRSLPEALEELRKAKSSNPNKPKIVDLAPIWDLSDQDVFDLLRLFGKEIPSYFRSCGVLLEIYGASFNETCQLNISSTEELKGGAGCKNSGRYGCGICTVNPNDSTGESLLQHTHWRIIGAERILRVRDYLSRLSNSSRRAYHAKSYDPALGAIMLQPNVLRTRELTKVVRYLSQVTADSIDDAAAFNALCDLNKQDLHPGIHEIKQSGMDEETKNEYLEMYIQACKKPLTPYFTLDHAVLLSLLWSLYGVPSLPYQPLKIYSDVMSGRGRIPYPKLNSELPASASKVSTEPVPEPFVLPLYVDDYVHTENDRLEDLYIDYRSMSELIIGDSNNCSLDQKYKTTSQFECVAEIENDGLALSNVEIKIGKNYCSVEDYFSTIAPEIIAYGEKQLTHTVDVERSKPFKFNVELGGVTLFDTQALISGKARKRRTRFEATPRKRKKVDGRIVATRSSLRFYQPTSDPALSAQHSNSCHLLMSEGGKEYVRDFDIQDELDDGIKLIVDEDIFNLYFCELDGIERAIAKYESAYQMCRSLKKSVFSYQCEEVVYDLLNCSGIKVHPDYKSQFIKLLTRTNVFNQRGAFAYSSMSREELEAEVGANLKTMAQHRSEKAHYLLNQIRPARNEKRRAFKALLAMPIHERVGHFVKTRIGDMVEIANKELTKAKHSVGYAVEWHSFKPAMVSHLFYLRALSSWESFTNVALTQSEKKACSRLSLSDRQELVSAYVESLADLDLNTEIQASGAGRFSLELNNLRRTLMAVTLANEMAAIIAASEGKFRLSLLDELKF